MPRSRASAALITVAAVALAACSDHARTLQAYPDELAGIGIIVHDGAQGHVIEKLVDGGPASSAGLREGDRIVAINGESTDGKTLASVVDALRGRAGSAVALTVDGGPSGHAVINVTRRALARQGNDYQMH